MASLANLSREERIGLLVAAGAHVALAFALMMQDSSRDEYTIPERMDVSLATEVSLELTAPDPSSEPAAAIAPTLSDDPVAAPPPLPEPVVRPEPVAEPVRQPPPPRPQPTQRAERRPAPTPTPAPRAERRPAPTPTPAPRATQTTAPRPQPRETGGASRIGSDFLQGTSDASGDRGSPAQNVGPAQQASIAQAIIRQLRPHWNSPSGVDVDKLTTVVRFRLNRDGSLSGNPEVLRTTGDNAANQAQVARHQEQAIRAVRLAAPFNLPEQFYSGWSTVTSNFDNRLAQ